MRKPRGGRLLIIEKMIPFARSSATAAWARAVNILSSVTNVPSTSEITAEHLNGNGRARLMTIAHRHRRGRSASVGHLAPKAHPLRSVLGFLLDRSARSAAPSLAQASSTGCTMRQVCSTMSARMNNVGSPIMTS